MSRYEEKVLPIRNRILKAMYDLRNLLSDHVNSDSYVKISEDDHAINITSEIADKLLKLEEEALAGVKELEYYLKIYPDKEAIEEDIRICAGTVGFLEELNLKGNLRPGTVKSSDGKVEMDLKGRIKELEE